MIPGIFRNQPAASIGLLLIVTLLSGCGTGMNAGADVPRATTPPNGSASASSDGRSTESDSLIGNSMDQSYGVTDQEDAARLQHLWVTRTTGDTDTNYPIGPGDILEVNAQYVDELRAKSVRVAGDGSIDLPLLGTLRAAGLSEEALSAEIARKLRKYVYNPEVEVFVTTYHSHQVAVIGAVRSAGLITLSDSQETIIDMLKRAGGTTPDAGDSVILFPAAQGNNAGQGSSPNLLKAADVDTIAGHITASSNHDPQNSSRPRSDVPQNFQPVIIPLHPTSLTSNSMSLPTSENFLRMPVRPGDLILVPGGGEVMVIGWVRAPGRFQITPGLTAMEAIAAAGGPLYAGDQSDVRLIRTGPSGTKRIISINFAAIKKGNSEDPVVFPNDVIEVPVSTAKLVPYELFTLIARTGLGVATGGMSMGVGGFGYVQ
jgi:polysaccharide biosynthesis/export protein